MKNNLLLVLLLAVCASATAQTKLIHYWSFNRNNWASASGGLRTSIPACKADYSVLDTNKAVLVIAPNIGKGNIYAYVDVYAGDTINMRMAAGAGNAYRFRSPSDSNAMVFYMPTTGYKNVKIQFEKLSSGSGATQLNFAYSTDSGATWKTSGLSTTTDSVNSGGWTKSKAITFTDATVNNNKKFVFKIYNMGTAGNDRFDNVTMDGVANVAVSEVHNAPAANVKSFTQNSNIVITSSVMMQQVELFDITGNRIAAQAINSYNGTINAASLAHGLYIIKVYTANGVVTRKQII